MKNGTIRPVSLIKANIDTIEGHSIEEEVRHAIACNEPIVGGAPSDLFTERKEGVMPQYDIRTDTWAIAQNAMDKVARSSIARRDAGMHTENPEYMKKRAEEIQKMNDALHSVEVKNE